ncbi:MAG TPA: hypothetical protein VKP69_12970 [Isosphaeraceae bacterium]|nr:hypothetical protein [Isosphaeraceae bacterium]
MPGTQPLLEHGQEPHAVGAPAGLGLSQVVEHGYHDQALAAALADDREQIGDGGDVAVSSSASTVGGRSAPGWRAWAMRCSR